MTKELIEKRIRIGYYGIGVYQPKTAENIGTLWRTADQLGAAFIFTIGKRYKKQIQDTYKSYRHIPLFQFKDLKTFENSPLYDCPVVAVDFGENSVELPEFTHPERAIYILGSEDNGLPKELRNQKLLSIPSVRQPSYNVAVAGSIICYDRFSKTKL